MVQVATTLKSNLLNQIKICSKIVGQPLEKIYESTHHSNILRLANNIVSDPNHVLNCYHSTEDTRFHKLIMCDSKTQKHFFVFCVNLLWFWCVSNICIFASCLDFCRLRFCKWSCYAKIIWDASLQYCIIIILIILVIDRDVPILIPVPVISELCVVWYFCQNCKSFHAIKTVIK